ncbi:hypothetical protein [Flavobacterium sp.]|uniref:hypothetical protein n=1 Tax=Flavobacterium sp. TaxID=239 RepID=UPI003D6AF019
MKSEGPKTAVLPKNLISTEKAKELNRNFNIKRADLHEKAIGKQDANAVWYSIEDLENYIEYIKTSGSEKGYVIDGIRFYFGVYSETDGKGKAGYSTLFLSPTGKSINARVAESSSSEQDQESGKDITSIEPLNFGSMGNPPKMEYGV